MTDEDPTEWLVDAGDPLLTPENLARIADPARPDRLAWNAFRILGLWNSEAWVPSLVEAACGPETPLVTIEWDGASIEPWTNDALGPEVCDVVIGGRDAYLVLACTVSTDPPVTQLRAAALAALDGSLRGGDRRAGLVAVVPPGAFDLDQRLDAATDVELHDGRRASELLEGSVGWATWTHLGRLALDLAEEGSLEPMEQVHRLVTELQTRWPEASF